MKWLAVVVLVVVGIFAAFVAIEYLTLSIHALPSWLPGHKAHTYGHEHKRGAAAALVALVCFAGAGFLVYRMRKPAGSGTPKSTETTSATQLLSGRPDAGQAPSA